MNIYVGNLAPDVTDDELREAFAPFGEIASVKVIRDGATGESRGFGFVEMPSEEQAKAAINEMNGKEIKGSQIRAEAGRAKAAPGMGGGGRRPGGDRPRGGGRPGGGRPGGTADPATNAICTSDSGLRILDGASPMRPGSAIRDLCLAERGG
jgi:cold-inducible RNA-binding protein